MSSPYTHTNKDCTILFIWGPKRGLISGDRCQYSVYLWEVIQTRRRQEGTYRGAGNVLCLDFAWLLLGYIHKYSSSSTVRTVHFILVIRQEMGNLWNKSISRSRKQYLLSARAGTKSQNYQVCHTEKTNSNHTTQVSSTEMRLSKMTRGTFHKDYLVRL